MTVKGKAAGKAEAKTKAVRKRSKPKNRNVVRPTPAGARKLKDELLQYMDRGGYLAWNARAQKYRILGTNTPKDGLGNCPECETGMLVIIRSHTTGKRFVGCSNYRNGCKASAPLYQRCLIKPAKAACKLCKWPLIMIRYNRKQKWSKKCTNAACSAFQPSPG